MKTVTYEKFLDFDPCWLGEAGGAKRIKGYFDRFGGSMTALDILKLEDVSADDRLWSVVREEFIDASIIHEFACVCAEYALSLIENPDPRSVNAIAVKRAWIRGEATDAELAAARDSARDAAWDAALDSARAAARAAAWYAALDSARAAARDSAWDAAGAAARAAARDAAEAAARAAAWDAAEAAARDAQIAYLIMVLEDGE